MRSLSVILKSINFVPQAIALAIDPQPLIGITWVVWSFSVRAADILIFGHERRVSIFCNLHASVR